MTTTITIIDRLETDIADWKYRQTAPRKKSVHFQEDWASPLHCTFFWLCELAYSSHWSRNDLILLVDCAIAAAEVRQARNAAKAEVGADDSP
jgi:hypothetical protein